MRPFRVIALAMILLTLSIVPASSQAPEQSYLARPAPNAQKSATNDYFVISARPGTRIDQALEVRNTSDDPVRLALNPVDASSANEGGVKYAEASEPRAGVGSWITVSRPEIRLNAGDVTRVRFTVRVPDDARQGVNIGGLVLQESDTLDDGAEIPDRTVIAVQVNMPGPRVPELEVTGVRLSPRQDAMYLVVGISNEGSGFTTGSGSLLLPEEVFEGQIEFGTFVPGTSIEYPVRWTTDPDPGVYDAQVDIEYGSGGRTAQWAGAIEVTARSIAELDAVRGVEGDEGSGGWGMLPLASAIGVAVLVALAALFGRRDRRQPVTVPAVEAGPTEAPAAERGATEAAPSPEPSSSTDPAGGKAEGSAQKGVATKGAAKKAVAKKGTANKGTAKKRATKTAGNKSATNTAGKKGATKKKTAETRTAGASKKATRKTTGGSRRKKPRSADPDSDP